MGDWDRSLLQDWSSIKQLKGEGGCRGWDTVKQGLGNYWNWGGSNKRCSGYSISCIEGDRRYAGKE